MADDVLIFVYGTLMQGCRAHCRMSGAVFCSKAKAEGQLYYVDRYPGMLDGEGWVSGEVYRVSKEDLAELDEYEGCFCDPPDYRRELRQVILEDGKVVEAYLYMFQLVDTASYRIPNDNWAEYMKKSPELNR